MAERTFEVEAVITVTVDNDDADAEIEARTQADVILQRAHDTDRGRHHVKKWHYELPVDGAVTDVTEELERQ